MNEKQQTPIVETPSYSDAKQRKATYSNVQASRRTNLFADVKAAVTTRQMAERYGLQPDRRGMVCCPFHGDKHPSMKVDARFHCFGCGADGDVIDFVARLRGVRNIEAARLIAAEIGLETGSPSQALPRQLPQRGSPWQNGKAHAKYQRRSVTSLSKARPSGELSRACETERVRPCYPELDELQQYLAKMRNIKIEYAPKNPEETLHPKFCEAVHAEENAAQLLAELSRLSPREQRMWKMSHPEEVQKFERANEQKL